MKTDPYFSVCGYKVVSERMHRSTSSVRAVVEVRIGTACIRRSASGIGPVHALDEALRSCLRADFPELEAVGLTDYRVSVVDASEGTRSKVRVLIEAGDGIRRWDSGAVSDNIVDASFEALCAAWVMAIVHARAAAQRSA